MRMGVGAQVAPCVLLSYRLVRSRSGLEARCARSYAAEHLRWTCASPFDISRFGHVAHGVFWRDVPEVFVEAGAYLKKAGRTGIVRGKHAISPRRHWIRHRRIPISFRATGPSTVQPVCNREYSVIMVSLYCLHPRIPLSLTRASSGQLLQP